MDCHCGYVSATESREKRAVHRAPRSAIHARNFASPIGSLSHALQMQSDPKFHRQSPLLSQSVAKAYLRVMVRGPEVP
jgi:hypothetical protein